MNASLSNSLIGQIIKEVGANYQLSDIAKETLVVIDSHGKVSRERPKGTFFFKSYRYFIIDTSAAISFEGRLCSIMGKHGQLSIVAAFTLKCQDSDIDTLALNISKAQHAGRLPNSLVQEEIERLVTNDSLGADFYGGKIAAENSITRVLKSFGITVLSLEIQLEGDVKRLQVQEIKKDSFRVSIKNGMPKVNLSLHMRIKTKKGQETKFLSKNISDDSVEAEVISIASNYFTTKINVDNPLENSSNFIADAIEGQIDEYLDAIGREVEYFSLSFLQNNSFEPLKLESDEYMEVRLSDSRQVFKLKYRCELLPITEQEARLFLYPVTEGFLKEMVSNQIKKTLKEVIDTKTFLDQLNTEVVAKLADGLDDKLSAFGRITNFLELELDPLRTPPRFLEVQHNVVCKSQDGHNVSVNNTLILQRDYSVNKAFEAYQVTDFTNWAKTELERITKAHVINQTYNQLLYDFKDFKLKEEFKREANRIGYHVDHLVIIPEFDPLKKSGRFRLEYKSTSLNSKIDGILLAVSVSIEGRINNYGKIMNLLAPGESIEINMEKFIEDIVGQFFNSIDPERFYWRFNSLDAIAGDKATLENELRELITKALTDEYDAEIRSVSVKQLDTKLIDRLKQLKEGVFEFEFQDKTGSLKYKAVIDILNVDPERWSIFNSKGYKPRSEDPADSERNDIKKYITDYVENGLNTELFYKLQKGELRGAYGDFIHAIQNLFVAVTVDVKDMFGLNIRIYSPLKKDLEGISLRMRLDNHLYEEENRLETKRKLYDMAMSEKKIRLEELYTQRRSKDGYLANSPELKRINEEIKEIEESLNPGVEPLRLEDPFN